MVVSSVQAGILGSAGQVTEMGEACPMVKVEVASAWLVHVPAGLSAVYVNEMVPPQAMLPRAGIDPMLVVGLHPPVAKNPDFQVSYAVWMSLVVLQEERLTSFGTVTFSSTGASTVKVLIWFTEKTQLGVRYSAVKSNSRVNPQPVFSGSAGIEARLDVTPVQPPLKLNPLFHVL